ncbi:MAG: class I SAM-dependent methyltransferase, partial [Armatimonadota bacterium]
KILDIGCGDGAFVEYMAKIGADCYAVEPDERTRELVSNYEGINKVWQDIKDVDESGFDVITMFEVIEHLTDPINNLKICNKLLKDNGSLIIKTPNFNAFERKLLGPDWISLEIPRHLQFYSESTLKKILNKSGFEIERIIYPTHDRALLRSIWLKITTKGEAASTGKAEYTTNSWRRKIDKTASFLLYPLWLIFSFFRASHSIAVHAIKSKSELL